MMPPYSVLIRTLGNTGEKYQTLLDCVGALVPPPEEVLVVLPEGYALPLQRLGWEIFLHVPKGMYAQKLYGIRHCRTEYLLCLDDDLAFSADFVEKLWKPIASGEFDVTAGPSVMLPGGRLRKIRLALCGAALPERNTGRYAVLLPTTGYTYREVPVQPSACYPTQSAPGACMFGRTSALREIIHEDELWVDQPGYGACDDTVQFYRAHLRGYRVGIVSDAVYRHLDGKASCPGISVRNDYAYGRNRVIFWHRFFYRRASSLGHRCWLVLCIGYRCVMELLVAVVGVCIGKRPLKTLTAQAKGIWEGLCWLKTKEYKDLPPV